MSRTVIKLKLCPMNFLEALACRIWIYVSNCGTGQEEIQNDRQNQEHSPKNQPKSQNSYRPWFSQICAGCRKILLRFCKAFSTSHIELKHCAQRKTPAHFWRARGHQIQHFHGFSKFWPHGPDLNPTKTFHHEFSRSSRLQNLNPHDQNWGWTRGNRKRSTGSRAQPKNRPKNRNSYRRSFSPICAGCRRVLLKILQSSL